MRDALHRKLLSPVKLAGLSMRNRIVKAGAFEGMCAGGQPSDALIAHHRALAAGGVGITTVAFCAVEPDGRSFEDQMYMHEGILPRLQRLTEAVHAVGGAVALQLGHCGSFSKNEALRVPRPMGPSARLNEYGLMAGLPLSKAMSKLEIADTARAFGRAGALAKSAGFDAIELHMGHGHLLSQFLSPLVNKRRDEFGGSLHNRLRFPVTALHRVREAVGHDFPIWAKINLTDGVKGGLEVEDAVGVAERLESEGIDAIQMSGGFTSMTPLYFLRGGRPLDEMIAVERNEWQKVALRLFGANIIEAFPFEEMYFLEKARVVRQRVHLPLMYLGGITSLENMRHALSEGFDFVAMARVLVRDPDLVRRIEAGEEFVTECDQCNKCIAAMETLKGIRCVKDESNFTGTCELHNYS